MQLRIYSVSMFHYKWNIFRMKTPTLRDPAWPWVARKCLTSTLHVSGPRVGILFPVAEWREHVECWADKELWSLLVTNHPHIIAIPTPQCPLLPAHPHNHTLHLNHTLLLNHTPTIINHTPHSCLLNFQITCPQIHLSLSTMTLIVLRLFSVDSFRNQNIETKQFFRWLSSWEEQAFLLELDFMNPSASL